MRKLIDEKYKNAIPVLAVIAVALFLHLELALFFSAKFGPHATVTREIWYYYGILKGEWQLPFFDPTRWILFPLSYFHETTWLPGLAITAALLSILTACLIFILGSSWRSDARFGLVAGLSYAAMHGPLSESTANFSHDLVMVPLMLAILLFAKLIYDYKSQIRILFFVGIVILTYLGIYAGSFVVFIGAMLSVLYLLLTRFNKQKQLFIIILIFGIFFLGRIFYVSRLLEWISHLAQAIRHISIVEQIKAAASDLLPISGKVFFSRYGLWIIPILFGIRVSIKRSEWMSLLIFSLGLLLATVAGRFVRIVDVGAALLIAHALISFKKRGMVYASLLGLCLFSLFINHRYLRPNTSEVEYRILRKVNESSRPGEKIFCAWHDGYMIQAISHLKPTATPEEIDFELPRVYWKSEEEAFALLKEKGVNLVWISNRYFGVQAINPQNKAFFYVGDGSLIYRPQEFDILAFEQLKETFLFRLMDDPKEVKYFNLILQMRDEYTPTWIRIYRLR